jgi:hypothetical protein
MKISQNFYTRQVPVCCCTCLFCIARSTFKFTSANECFGSQACIFKYSLYDNHSSRLTPDASMYTPVPRPTSCAIRALTTHPRGPGTAPAVEIARKTIAYFGYAGTVIRMCNGPRGTHFLLLVHCPNISGSSSL